MATKLRTDPDVRAMRSLVELSHHGWVIPVIMHLGRLRGARFAVLQRRLAVGRTTLERALAAASELNLTMRNPGHGHPLRPEYLLAPRGEAIASACEGVCVASESLPDQALIRRKWTLPVLACLELGAERFGDLVQLLPASSPRALAQALAQLQSAGWILRDVIDQRPPSVRYRLVAQTEPLAAAARALADAAR